MASTNTVRSPGQVPNLSSSDYSDTPTTTPTLISCPFRRSRSRVFYDSEITTATSWQFRGIDSPPPQLYQTQMHLSVLRSPQGLGSPVQVLSPNMSHGLNSSPMNMMLVASTTDASLHHRSIPSPPTGGSGSGSGPGGVKDDLSDGSRNSTGSSTGSHRSQDSGFSDSGEVRPSRRSLAIVSPHPSNSSSHHHNSHNVSPALQLQHSQILAAVSRCSSSNLPCDCSSVIGGDNPNRNHGTSNSGTEVGMCHHSSFNRGRNSATFVRSPKYPEVIQPIYAQNRSYLGHNLGHDLCHSSTTPVPSPIPHSGSGCGKLSMHRNGSNTFTLPLKSYPGQGHTPQGSQVSEYGEVNGNVGVGSEASNYIYQEIVQQQQQQQLSPPPTSCNPSQPCHHNHLHLHPPHPIYQPSQKRSSIGGNGGGGETGSYAFYSTISSSSSEANGHLGAPICSSTPKRSNLSASSLINPSSSSSSSRLGAMQKIDNFETLNKNQRHCLDNNNNSSSNSPPSMNVKEVKGSPRNLSYQFVTCSPQPSFTTIPAPWNSHQEKSPSSGNSSKNKKHSKLSLLSPSFSSSSTSHQSPNSSSTPNSNKTVVQRGPLPLPPVSEVTRTPSTSTHVPNIDGNVDVDLNVPPNANSFTPSDSSTHASHSQLKSCIKNKNISPKWKQLPKGYKRVSTRELAASFTNTSSSPASGPEGGPHVCFDESSPDGVIVVKSHFENDSMRQWLHELRAQTENECFYMLQTKSIISEEEPEPGVGVPATASDSDSGTYGSQKSGSSSITKGDKKNERKWSGKAVVEAIHNISAPLMSIKNVEQMANVVSAEFAKICKNIEFGFLSQVPRLVLNLVNYVEEFLRTFAGTAMFGNLQKLENKLSRSCRRLHRSAQIMMQISGASSEYSQPSSVHSIIESENLQKGEGYHVAVSEVVDGIVTVGNLFSQVVDLRLTRDLSCILDTVEGGGVPAKVALKSFANILMDGGNHLCRLASEIRTVRGMLGVILDAKEDYLRILSLRCLATVLCVGEAVKDFDRASGFEIVADFMYEPMYSFDLKIEAVSVFTQATDPWIDLETSLCTLESNLEKIVVALTNLIPACKSSEEPFLLVVAAISNLTFLQVSSMDVLRRCGTISFIITVIETSGANFSVFVLDHVATILANMAGIESCRDCVVKSGGIHTLLKFLHKKPTPALETAAEIMACERVQQKSTIAISRLCTEEGVAQLIMEKGGLHRLIQLSRNEKERNYSDGVLIAALATLRKLVSICGDEGIRGQQADDLIQPRLLDSFLLYSSRQESYV